MPENVDDILGVRVFAWRPPARYGARVNFGDELGPLIVRAMLKDSGAAGARQAGGSRLLSIGSVLHFAEEGDVVWGSGVNGKMGHPDFPRRLDVRAVRGPITRSALLSRGLDAPEAYGDPAMLILRAFPELRDVVRDAGTVIVPNLNELDRFEGPGVVSPLGDPLDVIRRIAAAEFVTGTSLHALIIADALGIPSRPIVSRAEHPLKYLDHYLGTGRDDVQFAASVEHALRLGPVGPPRYDPGPLIAAFPWDLWDVATPRPAAEPEHRPDRPDRAPGVSIVVRDNGDEGALRQTLRSVEAQTTPALDIRVVAEDVRATPAAVPRGDYLMVCDAGDLLPEGAVSAVAKAAAAERADVIVGDLLVFSPTDTRRPAPALDAFDGPTRTVRLAEEPAAAASRRGAGKAFSTAFLQRQGLAVHGEARSGDLVPVTTALLRADRIRLLPEVLGLRRAPGRTDAVELAAYLRQELTAAVLLASAAPRAIGDAQRSFLYRSEVLDQVSAFLKRRTGGAPADDDVAATMGLLMRSLPPDADALHPLEVLALALVAAADPEAAAAALTLLREPRSPVAEKLALWHAVLEGAAGGAVELGRAREVAVDGVRGVLAAIPASDADMSDAWSALAGSARRVLGAQVVGLVPESAVPPTRLAAALAARRRLRPTLTAVRARRTLELGGTVTDAGATPVLYDIADGRVLQTATARRAGDTWRARFRAAGLPLEAELGIAMRDDATGCILTMAVRVDALDGGRLAPFRLERRGAVVVVRRRRQWMSRGARSVARRVRDRLARLRAAAGRRGTA